MTTLYLCAAGNPEAVRLALTVNEAEQRWDRIVLLDDDPAKRGHEIMGVPVIGPFAALADRQPEDEAVNLVARSTKGRDGARAKIESFGIRLTSLIDPSVDLRGATMGRAVTIYAGSVISALSTVGDHSVIFTQAVLGHGATLGTGAVLAPGAVVNARVVVGERAYIGSNASVLPDLSVGKDATVSACSAAVSDVPANCTALGIPAEILGMSAPAAPITMTEPHENPTGTDAADFLADIQTVFAEALGQPRVGRNDNFFELGGNSTLAVKMQTLLSDKLGTPVTIVDIFRFPSPGQLASHLFRGSYVPSRPTRAEMRRRRLAQS